MSYEINKFEDIAWKSCPNCSARFFKQPDSVDEYPWSHICGKSKIQRLPPTYGYKVYSCGHCSSILSKSALPTETHCNACGSPLATMKLKVQDDQVHCGNCSCNVSGSSLSSSETFRSPTFFIESNWPKVRHQVRIIQHVPSWGQQTRIVDLPCETTHKFHEFVSTVVRNKDNFLKIFCPACWFHRSVLNPVGLVDCKLNYYNYKYHSVPDDWFPKEKAGEQLVFTGVCGYCSYEYHYNHRLYSIDADCFRSVNELLYPAKKEKKSWWKL